MTHSGLSALLLPCALITLAGCGVKAAEARADRTYLWVTRWDYADAAEVRKIVQRAADAGFDALLFQVRGAASTLYPSQLEPLAPELADREPGYDPLAVALEAAHARGIALHAWINVVPSWWGATPPSDPMHVYHRHPEWHWYDQHGRRQALSDGFYVSLNPCLPGVRDYLVAVVEELVTRYALDGLHLDYIRFPNEPPATPAGSDSDWPRDPATVSLFQTATGTSPEADPAAWDRWRAEQVTALVRAIRATVQRTAPGVALSAAVGAEPERALAEHFQDTERWLDEGLLDLVMPMNYTADPQRFEVRLAKWDAHRARARVVMGIHAAGDSALRVRQIEAAAPRFDALAVFAYHELFDSTNEVLTAQDEAARAERDARRGALTPTLAPNGQGGR